MPAEELRIVAKMFLNKSTNKAKTNGTQHKETLTKPSCHVDVRRQIRGIDFIDRPHGTLDSPARVKAKAHTDLVLVVPAIGEQRVLTVPQDAFVAVYFHNDLQITN